jgi:uncharacterized SAM-binding protein YcdF (DUF218 family)
MNLRWAIWNLTSPSQLLYLTAIVAALLLLFGKARAGRLAAILAGVFMLAAVPMARFLAGPLETRFPQPSLPAHVDGIILLAGAEQPVASEFFGEPQVGVEGGRYLAALRLAARYPAARLVYTGGPRHGKRSQTRVAVEILETVGLDSRRLLFEEKSRDSCDHPRNVRALVRPGPDETWVVVTSAMHMPRVVACFRANGWDDIIPMPTNYRSIPCASDLISPLQLNTNLAIVDDAAHEWIGLLYYRLSARTRELFPAPRAAFDPRDPAP